MASELITAECTNVPNGWPDLQVEARRTSSQFRPLLGWTQVAARLGHR